MSRDDRGDFDLSTARAGPFRGNYGGKRGPGLINQGISAEKRPIGAEILPRPINQPHLGTASPASEGALSRARRADGGRSAIIRNTLTPTPPRQKQTASPRCIG